MTAPRELAVGDRFLILIGQWPHERTVIGTVTAIDPGSPWPITYSYSGGHGYCRRKAITRALPRKRGGR